MAIDWKRAGSPEATRSAFLDRATAVAALVGVGAMLPLPGDSTTAFLAALIVAPITWRGLVRSRSLRFVVLLGVAAICSGWALGALNPSTHLFDSGQAVVKAFLLGEVIVGLVTAVWGRAVLGAGPMAVWFSVGMALGVLTRGINFDNPWKFSLVVPVTGMVLGLLWWRNARGGELFALLALAGISALNDSRSAASIAASAFLILIWQRLSGFLRLRTTGPRVALAVTVIGLATYFLMQAFILEGYLGEGARDRSEMQINRSGSVLVGGRPELGATIALIRASPMGYGMGVMPNSTDVYVAKQGMATLGYDPNNLYVENYMFGNGFEVHSVLGDLWIIYGVFGAVFGLAVMAVVWRGIVGMLAEGQLHALPLILAIQLTWDLLFAPFYISAARVLVLGLALSLTPRSAYASATTATSCTRTRTVAVPDDPK